MAKEETVPGTIGVGNGKGGGSQVKLVPSPITSIHDEATAREFVKAHYKVPNGDKKTFVTSDCNVFYQKNEGSARSHASKQKLKLFEITWD